MLYPDELLREVQRLARFGITQMDLKTGVATWSDEIYRLYGWEVGEVEPRLETLLSRVYPGDERLVRAAFERVRKAQAQGPLEFRIVRPDGEIRTLQVRAKLYRDEAGVPVRMLATTTDISEHKATAARLVFTDRMASVGALAAGVAHEINNPLAFISANLELIEADMVGSSVDVRAMLAETRAGVERIRTIVRGLGTFARADEDQRTTVSIEKVLDLAVLVTGPQIRHRAQLARVSAPVPEVVANQATLGQVFINMLVNATEAIPEGHVDGNTISISTRTDSAGWAVIEIRDTGAGIAPEIRDQIFDPFFTTKPIGKGTGLGLSICHGIVRSLGGEIGLESTPGRGTTFTIALPPAVAPARPEPVPAPAAPAAVPAPRTTKVLIVDDEVVFANALRRLLGRDQHQIAIVHSGHDALSRLAAGERFDAILCDLMMPAMSGMELHGKIAAMAREQAERMIFLTGGAFSPLAREFLDRARNPWFDKPCDLQALREAIRRVTNR